MRAAAEVYKVTVAVEADLGARLCELGHEVGLHEIAIFVEFGESLFARLEFVGEWLVARDDFSHSGFDGGEIFRNEGLLTIEVVEEAGICGRTAAKLGFPGNKFKNRSCKHVRGGMPDDLRVLRGSRSVTSSRRVSTVSGEEKDRPAAARRLARRHTLSLPTRATGRRGRNFGSKP